jgi:hypothetical protein
MSSDIEGWSKAMNTTTIKVLTCFALLALVVALTLVALMLAVPVLTHEPTHSAYY